LSALEIENLTLGHRGGVVEDGSVQNPHVSPRLVHFLLSLDFNRQLFESKLVLLRHHEAVGAALMVLIQLKVANDAILAQVKLLMTVAVQQRPNHLDIGRLLNRSKQIEIKKKRKKGQARYLAI